MEYNCFVIVMTAQHIILVNKSYKSPPPQKKVEAMNIFGYQFVKEKLHLLHTVPDISSNFLPFPATYRYVHAFQAIPIIFSTFQPFTATSSHLQQFPAISAIISHS